jgi:outer membrane protein, multidrug efflux system
MKRVLRKGARLLLLSVLAVGVGIVASALLVSCATYKKPKVPELQVPASFKNANHFSAAAATSVAPYLQNNWWQNFNDAKLNQLVSLALQNNVNYQVTLKNIQIARTYVGENFSNLFPQLNLNAGVARNATSINAITSKNVSFTQLYNLYQLNGSVSYEVDVWNRIRNSIKQAEANASASEADSNTVKLTLISNVVSAYWQIVALNSTIDNLRQQYAIAAELLRLNHTQLNSGLVNIEPVSDVKIQMEGIKSNLNTLEKQRQTLQNTLAYLVGEYPERFSRFNLQIGKLRNNFMAPLDVTRIIPPGIPSQMLINRPDIQKAFYLVLSYGYAQKQSIASFFPTFSLTGAYGFASLSLASLTAGNSILWNIGAGALQSLFDFGKRANQYKRSKLQYEAAILSYKDSVLNAFAEVNNALIAYQQDYSSLGAMQNALRFAQDKMSVANAEYQAGVIDYITYLRYRLVVLQNQYNIANQMQAVLLDVVQTYKTLGLGL